MVLGSRPDLELTTPRFELLLVVPDDPTCLMLGSSSSKDKSMILASSGGGWPFFALNFVPDTFRRGWAFVAFPFPLETGVSASSSDEISMTSSEVFTLENSSRLSELGISLRRV